MILVFKTSVNLANDIQHLSEFLNNLIGYSAWSFDLEDCDRILRVETNTCNTQQIVGLLKSNGFDCDELSD